MSKSQELRKAAADQASAAAEYGQQALKDGIARATVLLEDGIEIAQETLKKAQSQAAPAFHDARVKAADFGARKLDEYEPAIRSALDKVQPAVETARGKLADEYLPWLSKTLHKAAEHPEKLAEIIAPAKPKRSKGKTFLKLIALGAVVAGAVAAIRHFLAPKDDGWTAHEPSRAYVNNNDTFATAAKVATPDAPAEEQAAEEVVEETAEAADAAASEGYGEGSFVGTNPPEGYVIKGNERSKKFHVPGTGGYERTIAEVWFTTEEAAEAAGFTKAQR